MNNTFPTFKELYERFGTRPFLATSASSSDKRILIFINDNELFYEKEDGTLSSEFMYSPSAILDWFITDWFEDAPAVASDPARCTCDFYSVILVSGCTCGGE